MNQQKYSSAGPWDDEPDYIEFTGPHGYSCIIRRIPWSGILCGYVAIPKGHPWHKLEYRDLTDVGVHGGFTYSDHIKPSMSPEAVSDWWVGFDCGHGFDYWPGYPNIVRKPTSYRTIDYVKQNILIVETAIYDTAQRKEIEHE